MEADVTLYDLQTAVFQAVPGMLAELDGTADLKAAHAVTETEFDDAASLAAASYSRGGRGRGVTRFRGGRGGARSSQHPFRGRGAPAVKSSVYVSPLTNHCFR